MTRSWVLARRLSRHGLAVPFTGASAADAAAAMAGTHAQEISAAELALGLRLDGATRSGVRSSVCGDRNGDRQHGGDGLVKAFGPRGTVHLLPARDLGLWAGALAQVARAPAGFPPGVRLTVEQAEEVVAAIAGALGGPPRSPAGQSLPGHTPRAHAPPHAAPPDTAPSHGPPSHAPPSPAQDSPVWPELTIDELSDEVIRRTGPWSGELVMPAFQTMWPRWRQVLHLAGMRGVLCFGPNRGRKVTYTSPRRWLPEFRPSAASPALAWLVRTYLHAYGPSTPHRFANWLAIPPPRAVEIFSTLGDGLQEVDVEGARAWVVAGDTGAPAEPPAGVRLLPYFDSYSYRVGIHSPEQLYPSPQAERLRSGNFQNLLVDGVVAGLWQQRRSGRRVAITVQPLVPLTPAQRAELEEQAERVGAIMEGTADLTVGEVTAGPHA